MSIFLWFKPGKRNTVIVIIAVLAGIFLHFRNLEYAVYLSEDEARAFSLMNSGPLIYLLCRPAFIVSPNEWTAFYTAATLGLACIFLFYFLCRSLFDKTLSAYAVLFYAVFPYRINYSRMLYPPVFVDFFVLLLLLSFWQSLLKRKPAMMIPAGIFSAALLYVHPFTYSIIFGLAAAVLWLWRARTESLRGMGYFRVAGFYIFGLFLGYFILQGILWAVNPAYNYFFCLFDFGRYVSDATQASTNNLIPFFKTLWRNIFFSPIDTFRAVFVVCALVFTAVSVFKQRRHRLSFFFILCGAGALIFLLLTLLRLHEIRDRHFVWACPFLSLCLAYFVRELTASPRKLLRRAIAVCAFLFLFSSLWISYMVTVETFKTGHIQKWLEEQQISKCRVVTNLHLNAPGDRCQQVTPPVTPAPFCTESNQKFLIMWPLVHIAYLGGVADYIIPSGMSANVNLEENDPMLPHVRPVHSWTHPYSVFKYRFFEKKPNWGEPVKRINLYRLADVFSSENIHAVSTSGGKAENRSREGE